VTAGIIFNIQRFSIHDGPGIRSTVFFKGCSLLCFWCHNPEGRRAKPEIQFFPDRCIGCAECARVCEHEGHTLRDGSHVYDHEQCVVCGRCADGCFAGALQLTGTKVTVDEVMAEVLRDRPFYASSGGGVTLSGGEPLLQPDFARAILARCRAEGIHTAIETAANCRWRQLEMLLPVTDLVLMDIKHMDAAKHRAVTGVSNARILANARRLAQSRVPLHLRTPVIPTVNDTPDEIRAIAMFVRELQHLRAAHDPDSPLPALELLPFHRLAGDKFRSLGLDDRSAALTPLGAERMAELAEATHVCGTADA
jgi:pyruvate formate lyase activating enzyme